MIVVTIKNPKSGLSKMVDVSNYTRYEMEKTINVYINAGYKINFERVA